MSQTKIGMVHPGQMGISVASAAASTGIEICWASEGRSPATVKRAGDGGLNDLGDVASLCDYVDVVFSICPPDHAIAVAEQIAASKFSGLYVDCNAVSAATGLKVGEAVAAGGAAFVDGGIIGPPAKTTGTTRLYVSGARAKEILPLFEGSLLDVRFVNDQPGAASALKMAYDGWTKGSTALLLNQLALARAENVEQALIDEWEMSLPGLYEGLNRTGPLSAAKAWRFVGEMHEIADSLQAVDLPRAWFDAAADIYTRLTPYKDQSGLEVSQVVETIQKRGR